MGNAGASNVVNHFCYIRHPWSLTTLDDSVTGLGQGTPSYSDVTWKVIQNGVCVGENVINGDNYPTMTFQTDEVWTKEGCGRECLVEERCQGFSLTSYNLKGVYPVVHCMLHMEYDDDGAGMTDQHGSPVFCKHAVKRMPGEKFHCIETSTQAVFSGRLRLDAVEKPQSQFAQAAECHVNLEWMQTSSQTVSQQMTRPAPSSSGRAVYG